MSRSIKSKPTVQNSKINESKDFLNMTVYEENSIMCSLLDVLFERVKLQQEVRDRWFGHYLTIIGSLTALATLCLKFFEDVGQKEMLYMFLGLMFGFACLLGSLFYILYLYQRKNYKETYRLLSMIQRAVFKSISVIPLKLYEESTFSTKRHGADFYTLFIQSIIDATMFAIAIVFLAISQNLRLRIAAAFAVIGFFGMLMTLQWIRLFFEGR